MYIDKHKEDFIKDKKSGNYTTKLLSDKYKCSMSTVERRSSKWNLVNKVVFPCIDKSKEEFIKDRETYTYKQLSIKYNCSIHVVKSRINTWNLEKKISFIEKNKDNFISDYYKNMPIKELMKVYKCSKTTLYNKIKKWGVIKREVYLGGELTQELLKKLVHYNPTTGIFTYKAERTSARIGDILNYKVKGYVIATIRGKRYPMHRLAFLYMEGQLPAEGKVVDHINHIRDDNRWSNLRIVSRSDNSKNLSLSKRNSSGIIGVSKTIYGNWKVNISADGERFQEYFKTKKEATKRSKELYSYLGFHPNHGSTLPEGIYYNNNRYINCTPKDQTKEEKQQIRDFYNNTLKGYEVDHIKPIAKGGLHEIKNLQYLTAEENRRKGSKYPYEL